MNRLSQLLSSPDPIELRRHGLAVDPNGRIVSAHEARAAATRIMTANDLLQWEWPFRAHWARRLEELELAPPSRMARGTQIPPFTVSSEDYESIEVHFNDED